MIRLSYRALGVVLLAVAAVSGYRVYLWWNAAPSSGREKHITASSMSKQSYVSASQKSASVQPNTLLETKSLLQLHAAFRESQRCMEERFIIRGNESFHLYATLPPHIHGCDDMKGASRRLYEATAAAAKAGDIDAQMCILMQSAVDRESDFALSEAEIAEYRSLAPRYVDDAFKRGDWRVVKLLGFHVVDSAGLFTQLEQWKDPAREYKAHQLLLLGADDAVRQKAEYWLISGGISDSTLSAREIRDVNEWAHAMYDQYFSSQPKLIEEPTVCTSTDAPV